MFTVIASLSIIAIIIGIGLAVMAGSDPEGRGGNYVMAGMGLSLVGACGLLYVVISFLIQFFHNL